MAGCLRAAGKFHSSPGSVKALWRVHIFNCKIYLDGFKCWFNDLTFMEVVHAGRTILCPDKWVHTSFISNNNYLQERLFKVILII
jgi:hypothetical protein